MKDHNYIPQKAKVVERESLSPDCLGLKIRFPKNYQFNFHPGQFVMVSVPGFSEVPIGITTAPDKNDFEIGVRSAGTVTKKIVSLMVGDDIYINGPFGNGFPLQKMKGKNIVIIAAGIGIFPLRSLIRYLGNNKKIFKSLTIFVGSKCPESLIYKKEYKEWEKFAKVYTTVDSCGPTWDGCIGNITTLFDKNKINKGSLMIACGPPIIYKSIINRYVGKSIAENDLYFMLERKMKCGVGKCQHCTCGELYVCTDGPVFSYDQIKYNTEALS